LWRGAGLLAVSEGSPGASDKSVAQNVTSATTIAMLARLHETKAGTWDKERTSDELFLNTLTDFPFLDGFTWLPSFARVLKHYIICATET